MQQVYGYPNYKTCLAISDGAVLSNTFFAVWETAPQSGIFRNYHPPIPTDLSADDLAVPDFVPWQLKIGGITDTSLVTEVSITTSVDSTNNLTFSVVKGALLSDQKFILIPDGTLDAPPPKDYVSIRSDVTTPGTRSMAANIVVADATFKGGAKEKKEEFREKGALVLESYELDVVSRFYQGIIRTQWRFDESPTGKGYFRKMGYAITPDYKASLDTLTKHAKKNQVWYSLSHGQTDDNTAKGTFEGLLFLNEELITAANLKPLNLDYRLVLMDACSSAQTVTTDIHAAASNNALSPACAEFAESFGPNVAYVGWAWTVNPGTSQKYMAELAANLLYDKTLNRGRTVAEAHQKLLSDYAKAKPDVKLTLSLMKLHGATNNIIDERKGTK